jgi:hypothetical protein
MKTDSAAAIAAFLAKGKTITRLPAAGEAEAKSAARQQYLALRGEPEVVVVKERTGRSFDAENAAERKMEHFMECSLMGVSQETAIEDWNYMNGNGSGRYDE